MKQLIAIDATALAHVEAELDRLHKRLDRLDMTPKPEWITIKEMADTIGKTEKTVKRRIDAGQIEAREVGGERMVRFNPAA